MKRIIIAALLAGSFAAPVSATTLWNGITTDSTWHSLKGLRMVDALGVDRSISHGQGDYWLLPTREIEPVSIKTDFDGPGETANRVTLNGDGADTIEAGLIAKYGKPDSREVVHYHTNGGRFSIAMDEDHVVMKWRKDVAITFDRQASGNLWNITYEAIPVTTAQAAAAL